MRHLWISPHFMYRYDEWYRVNSERSNSQAALKEIIQASIAHDKNGVLPLPHITTFMVLNGEVEVKLSYFDYSDTILLFDFRRSKIKQTDFDTVGVRSILISDEVIENWVNNASLWDGYCKGFCDAAFIEKARNRKGASYKIQEKVSSIFLPFENIRMHMVDRNSAGVNVILGEFSSLLWESHGKTPQTIKQPRGIEIDSWEKLHLSLIDRHKRHYPNLLWKLSDPPKVITAAETKDTWVTKEQLREIEITSPEIIKKVMECKEEEDLLTLIDYLDDAQWIKLELLYSRHLAQLRRRDEKSVGSIANYELNVSINKDGDITDFDKWKTLLTPTQKEVVSKPLLIPIRLSGGPGTGKTLTAVLRTAELLRNAKAANEKFRIGFFVFNRDLGGRIYQQFQSLGLEEYFEENSNQQLVVTSLMEWAENFLELDKLGIEPIAPYRAGKMDKQREDLFRLVIEQAKKSLNNSEYELLWKEFDARSKNGLREIETEISQFIKARDIPNLSAYLTTHKTSQWARSTDKEFRKFVWEVYQVYEMALQALKMIDADDLVNDCFRQVKQTVWQKFKKDEQGFDYLILDEAHDFFRHQINLMAALVKDEKNIMMCFDQGQKVYSRYPTLREMGHDTDEKFFIRRLEVNFRNSKQILASLQALIANYPVYDYGSLWGQLSPNPKSPEGPKPSSQGFFADTGMMQGAVNLVKKYTEDGIDSREIAIICFDDEQLKQMEAVIKNGLDIKVHQLIGQGKRPPKNSIVLTTARQVKGEQFDVCILLGVDKSSLPDLRGGEGEIWASQKREDDFRLFAVAMSRCKRYLHFLWAGNQSSEFIEALGDTIEVHG